MVEGMQVYLNTEVASKLQGLDQGNTATENLTNSITELESEL